MESVYKWPHWRTEGIGCKTNRVTNTAYRGFGAPQALLCTETVMTHLASKLGMDQTDFRQLNMITPGYKAVLGCFVEDNVVSEKHCALPKMWQHVLTRGEFEQRKLAVNTHNSSSDRYKKGIALIPQKCAVCFEVDFMNQGQAAINIYNDGSVLLTTSAVEMGQGVSFKMAQLCATELGIPLSKITVNGNSTEILPNTQPTSASSGADVAGGAVLIACKILNERLAPLKAEFPDVPWEGIIWKAYWNRISLNATAHFAIPKLEWNWEDRSGYAGFYYSYGVAAAEVLLDSLTGEWCIVRADVIQDAGRSLNPVIDLGQVEGSFVQGIGYVTTEELKYNSEGLITTGPDDYLLPTVNEIPREWHVDLVQQQPNEMNVAGSKSTGEGPLLNAASVAFALLEAVNAVREANGKSRIATLPCSPLTTEKILLAINE
ncbi:hypothetical protein RCL1_004498 [Eukaryota sp. TZLM3-RCL]